MRIPGVNMCYGYSADMEIGFNHHVLEMDILAV